MFEDYLNSAEEVEENQTEGNLHVDLIEE